MRIYEVILTNSIRFLKCCCCYYYCGHQRTEEGIVELLSLFLRHHKPEEGIHPRRRRDKRLLGVLVGKDRLWRENDGR